MQNKLDNIIQELKELSGNSRLNIELPDNIFISAYERKIGFIFPKDSLYTTNFTEPLSYQGSAFLKLPKFP